MLCDFIAILALFFSVLAMKKCNKVRIEVVEKKLAHKRERIRKRYVLAVVLSEKPSGVDMECLDEAVKKSVEDVYGIVGLALSSPKVVYFDPTSKVVIIRTTLEGVKIVASALLKLKEGCGGNLRLIPIRAFGTLASARRKVPHLKKYLKEFD